MLLSCELIYLSFREMVYMAEVTGFEWFQLMTQHLNPSYFLYRSFQLHHVFNLDNENGQEDIPTLIDRKVEDFTCDL